MYIKLILHILIFIMRTNIVIDDGNHGLST